MFTVKKLTGVKFPNQSNRYSISLCKPLCICYWFIHPTRHQLSLINNGGNICLQNVDLNFGEDEKFVYNGGDVHFSARSSCMQFMLGGTLEVADNNTFHYGQKGMGLLALRQGGSITLGKNSTLIIDNTVLMYETRTTTPQQIFMELNPGSSLIFGKYAHLTNKYGIDKKMKLNIFMNGGVLDDSNLSKEERALINKIYPDKPVVSEDHSMVYPNPSHAYTKWIFTLLRKPKFNYLFMIAMAIS